MTDEKREMVVALLNDMPWYEWKRLRAVIDRAYENRANKVTLASSASLENEMKLELSHS